MDTSPNTPTAVLAANSVDAKSKPLTVSQLNKSSRELLETYLPQLWVEGELSNLSIPSSGHWYFTMKDARAQVRCAMFRNRNFTVRFKPQAGQKILVKGKVSLYEGRGDFQLIAEEMRPAGEGDLQAAFDKLKANLLKAGWFDAARKRPLPAWPKKLCVITSPTGAVVHDIAHVLKRRYPSLAISIIPVAVQGDQAADQIVQAIALANQHKVGDVIIVGRGGGSLEDLWPFNEERVAKAILDSALPVVSAVGHEVDFTIADFVADVRAPTPSAAAEIVSPNTVEILGQLKAIENGLTRCIQAAVQTRLNSIKLLQAKLIHPGDTIKRHGQAVDHLEMRLRRLMKAFVAQQKKAVGHASSRLLANNPKKRLPNDIKRLRDITDRLKRAQQRAFKSKQEQLKTTAQLLNSVSPLATLDRGYSILQKQDQSVVREGSDVKKGEKITARLAHSHLQLTVDAVEPKASGRG